MRFLFAITEPYLPDVVGGGVLDIDLLGQHLLKDGHEVEVIATHPRKNTIPHKVLRKLGTDIRPTTTDQYHGYDVTRTTYQRVRAALSHRLGERKSDVVVLQGTRFSKLIPIALAGGARVIIRVVTQDSADEVARDARANPHVADAIRDTRVSLVSNSEFVSKYVTELLRVPSPMIYPFVNLPHVTARDKNPQHITLVNPSHVKGVDVALAVAELLPHQDFLFLRSWPLSPDDERSLATRIATLPNVRVAGPVENMADVYATTLLLFVPSRQEAFGRVALEAAANAIPQVVSSVGGLPEAAGPGGVVLEIDEPASVWAAAIDRILGDKHLYSQLAREGLAHANRVEFTAEHVGAKFVEIASQLVSTRCK
jgi:glycosyltransferase involved in cell wall biosynthesis